MKPRLPQVLLGALVLGVAALAFADWLPLIHSLPVRDNPNDPSNPFLSRSQGITAGPPTPMPTITPTSVCGHPADSSTYNFEGGISGWANMSGATQSTLFPGTTTAEVCDGSGSLCGTVAYTGATEQVGFAQDFASPGVDWTGRVVTAEILLPAAMAGMSGGGGELFVQTGGGYTWNAGSWVNFNAAGWMTLTLDMSAVTDPSQVMVFGINLQLPGGAASGSYTFCADTIQLSAAPTPTVTPTATTTPTPGGIPPTATGTPTPIPTSTPGGLCDYGGTDSANIAGFESGVSGWASLSVSDPSGYAAATLTAGTGNPDVCNGTGSLCGLADYNTSSGAVQVGYADDADFNFAGDATITAMVYFPPAFYLATADPGAQLYVKTGSGYTYYSGATVNVPGGGGWVQLSLDLNGAYLNAVGSAVAVANTNDALEIGVVVYDPENGPSGSYTICVDSISAQ